MFTKGLLRGPRILVTGSGTGLGKEMVEKNGRLVPTTEVAGALGQLGKQRCRQL